MSVLNRREAIGVAAGAAVSLSAVAVGLPAGGEGLEQRAYREFLADGVLESDARDFARESMLPGGLVRIARLRAGWTPGEAAVKAGLSSCLRIFNLETYQGAEMSMTEGTQLCQLLGIRSADLVQEFFSRREAA